MKGLYVLLINLTKTAGQGMCFSLIWLLCTNQYLENEIVCCSLSQVIDLYIVLVDRPVNIHTAVLLNIRLWTNCLKFSYCDGKQNDKKWMTFVNYWLISLYQYIIVKGNDFKLVKVSKCFPLSTIFLWKWLTIDNLARNTSKQT